MEMEKNGGEGAGSGGFEPPAESRGDAAADVGKGHESG